MHFESATRKGEVMITVTATGEDMNHILFQLRDILRSVDEQDEKVVLSDEQLKRQLDFNIEDLEFSIRASRVLIQNLKLLTMRDVIQYGRKNLLQARGLGVKTVREITEMLEYAGLNWNSCEANTYD